MAGEGEAVAAGARERQADAAPALSEKARRWLEENAAAIDSYNRYIEEHGLPLAEYRTEWLG